MSSRVAELEAALSVARTEEALVAVKEAYRADPSDELKAAKLVATAAVVAARNAHRADRTGVAAVASEAELS